MIVQSIPEGPDDGSRFVIKLGEHLDLAGQFAENFSNDEFASPEPREEFLYVCRWHDKGWQDLDDNPPLDPKTGCPTTSSRRPCPSSSSRAPAHPNTTRPAIPIAG